MQKRQFHVANFFSSPARDQLFVDELRVLAPVPDKYSSDSTRLMVVGGHKQMVQGCYHIHTRAVLSKWLLERAWQKSNQDVSLLRWAFDAGLAPLQLWQIIAMLWPQNRFRCGNSTRGTLNPETLGSRQGFLGCSISSYASGSGALRSVHHCRTGNAAKRLQFMEGLMSSVSSAGGGETGNSRWQVSKCSQMFTAGKCRF